MVDEHGAPPDLRKNSRGLAARARGWVTGSHGSSLSSGRSSAASSSSSARSSSPSTRYISSSPTPSWVWSRRASPRHRRRDLEPHDLAEAAASSSTSPPRGGRPPRRETSKSAFRVTRKTARSRSPSRVEHREEVGDHVPRAARAAPLLVERQEARQALRDLHPREALLAGVGVARRRSEAEREPEMYGNGCPGPTASGVRTGKMSRSKRSLELRGSPPRRTRRRVDDDALRGSAGGGRESRGALARAVSSRDALRISASVCRGVRPSAERTPIPPRWPTSPATRTMKNSSRFEAKIEGNLTRSSSGTSGSARARALER